MHDPIRVLLVDDDSAVAERTAEYLQRQAEVTTVETVTSASDALDRLDDDFDGVVSAHDIPETTGLELLEAVRENAPELPFILFTGRGSEEVASQAIGAGVTDYLQKGTGTDQYELLANRLIDAVEQRRARGVTDRKAREAELERANERLRETQKQLTLALGANEMYTWTWDLDTDAVERTPSVGDVFGVSVDLETVFDDYLAHVHPDDQPRVEQAYRAARDDGESFGVRYRLDLGEGWRWIEERGEVLDDTNGAPSVAIGTVTDVTERRRRERELQVERDRLSTLFENFPEPAIEYEFEDGEPVVRATNEAFVETFGYGPEEATDTPINELIVPPDRRDEAADLDGQVRRGERLDAEIERLTATGNRVFRFRNIALAEGTDAEGFGVYSDVTERKAHERDLKRGRDRMRAITDTIPDVLSVYDAEGRYQEVLTGQDHLLVDDPANLQGATIEGTLDPPAAEALLEAIERTIDTGTVQSVEYSLELDGSRTWFEGRLAPLGIDEAAQVVLLARDVTDRKGREGKLDRLRQRSQKLMYTETKSETAKVAVDAATEVIGTLTSGVHLLSDDGATLEGSVMTESVYEMVGEAPSYRRDAEPGSRSAIVWETFERGEPLHLDDAEAYEPLTETPLSRSALMHPVGRHGMFIAAAPEPNTYDETDKALFEILATSLTTALDRVEREANLREQERELERQNERLEEFAGVIAHDLRNPLNVLLGSLELAEETDDPEAFDRSRRAVGRMEQLIDDMLRLARAGQTVAEMVPLDLASVVDACWTTVDTGDAGLENQATRPIQADEGRLQQLLENLIRNAVEHGGDAVTVTVGDLADGFYVEDDGPGIPSDVRDRVFESGFSTADEGTGFGLAIVEEIAAAHGWAVDVELGLSGGARFEISGVSRVD